MNDNEQYQNFFPLMSWTPGIGSPMLQNTAGFPAGITGGLPIDSNVLASFGPDPFQIGGASFAQTAEPAAASPEADTKFQKSARKFGFYMIGVTLLLLGLAYFLWQPTKKAVLTVADAAV